jgi:hypothetical protein
VLLQRSRVKQVAEAVMPSHQQQLWKGLTSLKMALSLICLINNWLIAPLALGETTAVTVVI